jgi:Transglycosylase-like domain
VPVARTKLVAAAGALGLAFGVVTHAAGFTAQAPTRDARASRAHHGSRQADHAKLAMFSKPKKQFAKSLELARRKAQRAQASNASSQAAPGADATSAGGFPSPESVGVSSTTLNAIAACESGGDPTAVSADGTYRGLYQFDYGTWASVGGSGDPAAASAAEQSYRAALLYSRSGSSPWPICG